MNLPSHILENAVEQFSSFPGIGKKTALRMVLFLLKQNPSFIRSFGETFIHLPDQINFCGECNNLSETPLCSICSSSSRDKSLICVVEELPDLLAVENTHQFKGVYHVLGGVISPLNGIGPSQLKIEGLARKAAEGCINEVIFAFSATMEGDTTAFYLYKKLQGLPIKVTTLSRGMAIGDELEFTDEVTLGRSLLSRTPYENSLAK